MEKPDCAYCADTGGQLVWSNPQCRVVLVPDAPITGWCRVIWNTHKRELTDLSSSERDMLMAVTFSVEAALRKLLSPEKMNVASLGTGLPHIHWHVIPRFADDTHFPEPVWVKPLREKSSRTLPTNFVEQLRDYVEHDVGPR